MMYVLSASMVFTSAWALTHISVMAIHAIIAAGNFIILIISLLCTRSLLFQLPGHQIFYRLFRVFVLIEQLIDLFHHGHLDMVFVRESSRGLGGFDTFGNGLRAFQDVVQLFAFAEARTERAVSRQSTPAGEKQVAP